MRCRPGLPHPSQRSPYHSTKRQTGKHVVFINTFSPQETPGQKPSPRVWSSSPTPDCGSEALRMGGDGRASALSIFQENSGLGGGRAPVKSGPLLTSQATGALSLLWCLRSVTQHIPTGDLRACHPSQGLGQPQGQPQGSLEGPQRWRRVSGGQGHCDASHLHSHFPAGHRHLSSPQGCLRHRQARAPGHRRTSKSSCPSRLHPRPWDTATHRRVQGPALASAVHMCLGGRTEGGSTESPVAFTWGLSLPLLVLASRFMLRVPCPSPLLQPHPFLPTHPVPVLFPLSRAVGGPGPRAQLPTATGTTPQCFST